MLALGLAAPTSRDSQARYYHPAGHTDERTGAMGSKARARLLQRGPTTCSLCGCSVSDAAQHNAGKRHQSNRFYGYNAVVHQVRDLRIPRDLPANVHPLHSEAPERLRPADVPDRHVQTARVAPGPTSARPAHVLCRSQPLSPCGRSCVAEGRGGRARLAH